ncbi:hypothetical protein Pyn_19032 [Prunus yedoensis var. nudiflora]|uniref:Uncharacterized protein n=1 Tax=Prunus yedoensis var. nudiflora TaxID=2094558 RepID=A0A314Z955_PRUYE|nr:hypothetical protein Pyn_19032 [Prunus yedoensis var. nudiflora]
MTAQSATDPNYHSASMSRIEPPLWLLLLSTLQSRDQLRLTMPRWLPATSLRARLSRPPPSLPHSHTCNLMNTSPLVLLECPCSLTDTSPLALLSTRSATISFMASWPFSSHLTAP